MRIPIILTLLLSLVCTRSLAQECLDLLDTVNINGYWSNATNDPHTVARAEVPFKLFGDNKKYSIKLNSHQIYFTSDSTQTLKPNQLKLETPQHINRSGYMAVTVYNLPAPGRYAGRVRYEFSTGGKAPVYECEFVVDIELEGKSIIEEFNGTKTVLTRNRPHGILENSPLSRSISLDLNNHNGIEIIDPTVSISAVGQNGGLHITMPQLFPRTDLKIKGGILTLRFKNFSLEPDEYIGQITIKARNLKEKYTVPLSLKVKDPPFLAFIIIVFGLIAGRLIKLYTSQDVRTYFVLDQRVDELIALADLQEMDQVEAELK